MIKWVIFDVGETLIKERRMWDGWADWLGVERDAFWAELEKTIAERRHHRDVFEYFKPGFDVEAARLERAEAGYTDELKRSDLYVDVRSTIKMLAARNIGVGVAGNQPASTAEFFSDLNWPIDLIGMSGNSGIEKPKPIFFDKLIELTSLAPGELAYVGDRLDNDVFPAQRAGMQAVFLRRGLWGKAHATWPEAEGLPHVIDNLTELLGLDLFR